MRKYSLENIAERYDDLTSNGDFFYKEVSFGDKEQLAKDMAWLIGELAKSRVEIKQLNKILKER